jgi:hypothetical protein
MAEQGGDGDDELPCVDHNPPNKGAVGKGQKNQLKSKHVTQCYKCKANT